MARAKTPPSAEELFLAPLAALAAKRPEIEALVFWGGAEGWQAEPAEALESEEIAFYAEGLIPEGFNLEWRIVAEAAGSIPDHIQLFAWEEGEAPPALADWQVLQMARWPG